MKHIVIIGNGISGVTAARHIRKLSDYQITIVSGETKYFFSRTALMYIYMGHMKFEHTQPYEPWFWEKNRINVVQDWVVGIDYEKKSVALKGSNVISYDQLIIATGSKSNFFDWPGQDLTGVQGLYSYQDLEKLENRSGKIKNAVIVGGGLIGVELAEMLHSRNIHVTFLVREKRFWGNVLPELEGALVANELRANEVDVKYSTELKEIVGNEKGEVKSVVTSTGGEISCEFVGITTGVRPNVEFLKGSSLEIDRGVLVNEYLQTNIDDVFAIGDCVQHRNPIAGRKAIEQVWYTGRMMGETVARTICEKPLAYQPGHWFNSAKFFGQEYQTYGNVNSALADDEEEFYWENKNENVLLHFVFDKVSRKFKGVNALGIRLRHELMDEHLTKGSSIEEVLVHLNDSNFDPEFFKRYETAIVAKFNSDFKTELKLKKKSWKRILKLG